MSADRYESVGDKHVDHIVARRLRNGKWPVERVTWEIVSEHDTIKEAADAAHAGRADD